ncbi:MAG: alpha/beta fold hydrolase [Promethearchaeota archaeon]
MPYFEYSKKQIFYQIKDNDSENLLILIHGAANNSNMWENQFYLNIDYNIVAIDLPSHNKSSKFPKLSLDLYTDVVKNYVDLLKPKKLILGGHSMGGAIIQDYYFKYSEDVYALILCATGARLRVSPIIFNSIKPNYQTFLDNLRARSFYKKTSKKIIDDSILEASQIQPEVTYIDFKICDAFDTLHKTDTIETPCLIICGKEDKTTPLKYSLFFHEKITNSQFYIIEKAAHSVIEEKPKEVNDSIENFINNYLNNYK